MGKHIALYGNEALVRGYCRRCKETAFVIENKLQCCDAPLNGPVTKVKRISEPEFARKIPKKSDRDHVLYIQENKCIYCERSFNSYVDKGKKYLKLTPTWDHFVPWIFNQDNNTENFVASCQICNGFKSAMIFESLDAAKIFILNRWQQKGYK